MAREIVGSTQLVSVLGVVLVPHGSERDPLAICELGDPFVFAVGGPMKFHLLRGKMFPEATRPDSLDGAGGNTQTASNDLSGLG